MTEENLLVRVLGSCETMANASAIYADKLGTLIQNEMTVFAGIHNRFIRPDENLKRTSNKMSYPNSRLALSNLNATRTLQLVEPFSASIETALSKSARNLGWASYRDALNGTNLIPFSTNLKAILHSNSAVEVTTPRCMRNVVVFYGPRLGRSRPHILRDRRREDHEPTSRDHRSASRQASQEGDTLTSPNVVRRVSTRRRTHIASSRGQQQLSTAEICLRDPSSGMSSTQLQPYAVAPSPNTFQSHHDNGTIGSSSPCRESLPAAVDSTGALWPSGNGNGATRLDSFPRGHTGDRGEELTATRDGRANGMAVYSRGQLSRARDRFRGLFFFVVLFLFLLFSLLPVLRSPFSLCFSISRVHYCALYI
jgi:hypothetical protein